MALVAYKGNMLITVPPWSLSGYQKKSPHPSYPRVTATLHYNCNPCYLYPLYPLVIFFIIIIAVIIKPPTSRENADSTDLNTIKHAT